MKTKAFTTILAAILFLCLKSLWPVEAKGAFSLEIFTPLEGMRIMPAATIDSEGNLHVVWDEYVRDTTDSWSGANYIFCEKIRKDGHVVIDKTKVSRAAHLPNLRIATDESGSLYIVSTAQHTGLYVARLSAEGDVVYTIARDSWKMRPDALLVDRDRNLHIIGSLISGDLSGGPLYYATFGRSGMVRRDITLISKGGTFEQLTNDLAAAFTKRHTILVCSRVRTNEVKMNKFGYVRVRDSQQDFIYFLVDTQGNLLTEPRRVSVEEEGFRKIPGKWLGGIDMTRLPNGDIIVSMSSTLVRDGEFEDAIYQLKFSPDGSLIHPAKLELMEPRPIEELPETVTPKVQVMTWHRPQYKHINEYYLYGFDSKGNFYYSTKSSTWRW